MATFQSSNCSFFVCVYCTIYAHAALVVSILSTIVILVQPSAAPPMPDRKSASPCLHSAPSESSISTNTSSASTSSTLVEETPSPACSTPPESKTRSKYARQASVSFLNATVILPSSKTFTRPIKPITRRLSSSSQIVSHTFKESIISPTSKLTQQIIPASKASSQKTVGKVVSLTRQSVKATKKFVQKI
ncbi:hypothetical protein J3R30DRAFT_857227 [Lentinula aciculospora]|uniref:Uncharacterized protein n=1 Tax=Lentinula aciculospora TaxID=153920 RepID=A0A9W9DW03_9AGAR|nr:hypothetical protein J3R30DRAFT_857227 [Lentinula aciculospora]